MDINYLLLLACLPVVFLCMYIYNKDNDKEPKRLLKKIFLFGIVTIIPIVILELIIGAIVSTDDSSNLVKLFIASFVGIGLIEEGAKWVVTNKCIYNDKEFNHQYDAIVYAVFASLGFAFIENVLYVVTSGVTVGILRALTTVPSHACDGIFMGYFLGKAKQESYNKNQKAANKYMLYSLLIPVLTHTLFDYLILSERTILIVIFFIYTLTMYIICFILINKVSKINYNFDGKSINNKIEIIDINSSKNSFNYALLRMLILSVILIIISSFLLI